MNIKEMNLIKRNYSENDIYFCNLMKEVRVVTEHTRWTVQALTHHATMEQLFDSMFLVINLNGEITYIQETLATFLRYDTTIVKGRNIKEFLEQPDQIANLISDSKPCKIISMRDGNGLMRTSECSIYQLEDSIQPCYILSFQHETQEVQLTLLQRFAGSFIRDVNLGVILIDPEFKLVEISDYACKVLGVNRIESIGKILEEVFANIPQEYQLIQRNILEGAVVKNQAISWTNHEQRYELILDSSVLLNYDGQAVGGYVLFKDVSQLRSLEQQVQRNDKLSMIGQIAAGTAHEIRNPLTSIKGFLQLMKRKLHDKGMEKEFSYTELMLSEINRINNLVNDFLLLSKPKKTNYTKIDLSSVIREILPIVNNQAILHDVTVEYQSSLELPPIIADRELLKQLFINICKNGIEAMVPDGGTLSILERIDLEGQLLNVLIQDTGPGIPSFVIDKIFDPFFTTKEEGTGLGLSVCQRIIHDIGGTLRVSSKGFGTIFIVSIPIPQALVQ
jgi:nitrogen-specific signal transduction histidine kinase